MDFLINLLAEFVWFLTGIVVTFLGLRSSRIRGWAKHVGIKVHFDKPQLDFDIIGNNKSGIANLIVKNAGNRPAYNVYSFLFEGSEINVNFSIKSLGEQKVRSGVLAAGEKVKFTDKQLQFVGCNIMVRQEIWVDYSDEDGDHYRTIVLPTNPRGDDMKVLPPIRIQNRIPLAPNLNLECNEPWGSYRNGQKKLMNLNY